MTRWGVEDTSWFWSLGIFAVFLVVLILLLMLYLLLKLWQYVSKRGSVGKAVAEYFEKKLFFSAICRYIIESYLKIVYNTLIFLAFNARITSKYQRIQAIGLSVIFGLLLLWPVLIASLLTTYRNRLDDEPFKRRFESLYLGNKTNNYLENLRTDRKICYLYTFFFCIRRLALVLSIYWMKEERYMQCIYALIAIQSCYILYMAMAKPHIEDHFNYLELFNETFVLLILYTMISFNPSTIIPLVDSYHQWIIGFVVMGLIGAVFFVNLSMMMRESVKNLKKGIHKFKIYRDKRRKKALIRLAFHMKGRLPVIDEVSSSQEESIRVNDINLI